MATSAAALTPTPSNPPNLLTIPAELRVRIYEFIFTGKVLTLGVNKALHPALNLLRACKKIYKETRLVVLRCMMLRILNVVESCNAVPRELREAYLPHVREISLCCADCRDIDPNLDFRSYATSLQCLDLGYVCSTGSYDPENTFKATINQNCGFGPGFVGTFWDHQLLHLATWDCEYFRTGVVSVPPPPGTSWLDELLSNKHRGFALQCTVVAFLGGLWENVERRYGKGTIVLLTFDFSTLEVLERKVWGSEDGESSNFVPLLTVEDAKSYIFSGNDSPTASTQVTNLVEQDGKRCIWIGNTSDLGFPSHLTTTNHEDGTTLFRAGQEEQLIF